MLMIDFKGILLYDTPHFLCSLWIVLLPPITIHYTVPHTAAPCFSPKKPCPHNHFLKQKQNTFRER
jgi:hypothetical protein